ncbi:MAG TPA: hypothetical protein VMF13_15410, partial [Luteitalea sp.]|nr:hypothetical protein [Luteitalea sp.]
TVLEVDLPRKRIALTMRKAERPAPRAAQSRESRPAHGGAPQGARPPRPQSRPQQDRRPEAPASSPSTAMSAAFQKLLGK